MMRKDPIYWARWLFLPTALLLLVGAVGCVVGKAVHETWSPVADKELKDKNRVYAFMGKLTSSDTRSRNRADLNFKDLSDSSAQLLVHLLIDAFGAGDADIQWRALAHLAHVGPRASIAVPFLVEQGRNANADIRGRVAFALEKIGPTAQEAIPALILLLDDEDEHVRASSASALRVFGCDARDAVHRLIRNLDDPYSDAQTCAAAALGSIGPDARQAVPALLKAVETRKGNTLWNVIWALGQMGPDAQQAVPILSALLDHEDKEARLVAIDAIGLIRPTDEKVIRDIAGRIVPKDMEMSRHLIVTLGRIGTPAVPYLADLVTNEDAEISFLSIRSLGDIGPDAKQAIPALVAALEDRRFAGPSLAAAYVPRTIGDWARIALDKIQLNPSTDSPTDSDTLSLPFRRPRMPVTQKE